MSKGDITFTYLVWGISFAIAMFLVGFYVAAQKERAQDRACVAPITGEH